MSLVYSTASLLLRFFFETPLNFSVLKGAAAKRLNYVGMPKKFPSSSKEVILPLLQQPCCDKY